MTYMKLIIAGTALFAIAAGANAQQATSSGTVQAEALLLSPITVATPVQMDFGAIVITAEAGSVVLSTADVRSATGGATLGNSTDETAAEVLIGGAQDSMVTVTLGGVTGNAVVLAKANAPTTLTLTNFTVKNAASGSDLSAEQSGGYVVTLGNNGNSTLRIGGKLNIPEGSEAGAYSTNVGGGSAMTVTVQYN